MLPGVPGDHDDLRGRRDPDLVDAQLACHSGAKLMTRPAWNELLLGRWHRVDPRLPADRLAVDVFLTDRHAGNDQFVRKVLSDEGLADLRLLESHQDFRVSVREVDESVRLERRHRASSTPWRSACREAA